MPDYLSTDPNAVQEPQKPEDQPQYLSTDPTAATLHLSTDPAAGLQPQQQQPPAPADSAGMFGALAHGFVKAFPSVAAAAEITGAAEPFIGAAAAATAPTVIGPAIMEAAGNAAVFLGTLAIGNRLMDHGEKALSENSSLVKNYLDTVQQHPVADQIGQLLAFGPQAATSIKGFYDLATNAKSVSEAAKAIGTRVAGGAAAGTAITPLQPGIDWGVNQLGQAFGLPPEEIQKPSIKSALTNIGIGVVLSGGHINRAVEGAAAEAPPTEGAAARAPYFNEIPPIYQERRFTMPPPETRFTFQPDTRFTMQPEPRAQVQPTEPLSETLQSLQAQRPPLPVAPPTALDQTIASIPTPAGPQATADITRDILNRRTVLINEAQQLSQQAQISKAATGTVHPAVEERLAEINQELNQSVPQAFPGQGQAPVIPSETARFQPPQRTLPGETATFRGAEQPPEAPVNAPGGVPIAPERAAPSPVAGVPAEAAQPQGTEARPTTPAVPVAVGGQVTGISQARTEAELGPGSVTPGAGREMGSGIEYGRKYINAGGDPRAPIRRALSTGSASYRDVGIVHAELERLRGMKYAADQAASANPGDAALQQRFVEADNAQRAWRKELQPVLTSASDTLRAAYDASSPRPNVGTYSGLTDLVQQVHKGSVELSPADRTALKKMASGVTGVRQVATDRMADVQRAVAKTVKEPIMTPGQLDADLQTLLKNEFKDCVG